jgi:hypothetical protein
MTKKNATSKRDTGGAAKRVQHARKPDGNDKMSSSDRRSTTLAFPPELTKSLLHESGLFGAVMMPIANLAAFAGHPDPHICAAGLHAAYARGLLNDAVEAGLVCCASCGGNLNKASRIELHS